MITLLKDSSLVVAEVVVALMSNIIGDGTPAAGSVTGEELITDLMVRATTVDTRSALLISNQHNCRHAWVFEHRVSDSIVVMTADGAEQYTYDLVRGPVVNSGSVEKLFNYNQHYDAAGYICDFLLNKM